MPGPLPRPPDLNDKAPKAVGAAHRGFHRKELTMCIDTDKERHPGVNVNGTLSERSDKFLYIVQMAGHA